MINEIGRDRVYTVFSCMDSMDKVLLKQYPKIPVNANTSYVKYTSRSTMYDILESDSLYLFCSELSNDKMENKLIERSETCDAYITCFYHISENQSSGSDVYSQWMSYCRDGGAAFEFYFGQDMVGENKKEKEKFGKAMAKYPNLFNYSLIYSDAKKLSEYIRYVNFPYRVQYYDSSTLTDNSFKNKLKSLSMSEQIELKYIAPYFKHCGFVQESEARLAMVNTDNCLSRCIRYIIRSDGSRLPYIAMKFGDIDSNNGPCIFSGIDIYNGNVEKNLRKLINDIPVHKRNKRYPIIIPQGNNQEKIYNIVEKIVDEAEKSNNGQYNIICQGHLPITQITLAPTVDRDEQVKMMEIFCKGKYWLRRVRINKSEIPYNTSNCNHL